MDIKIVKLIQEKVTAGILTIEEARLLLPGYEISLELKELLETEEVTLYLQALETDQVKRYLELTAPKKGHGGTKTAMPCRLCGEDSHHVSWSMAKIDGINHWVGTMKEHCSKYPDERFRVPVGSDKEVYDKLPLSVGQEAGRNKVEKEKGLST